MFTSGPAADHRAGPAPSGTGGRARFGRELVVALVVAATVALAGAAALLARPAQYTAAATLVVLPAASLTGNEAASYYDTLSQGQVVGTFAEVLRASLSVGPADAAAVSVVVVPDTSVVRLVATRPTRGQAESAADEALDASAEPLQRLSAPYRASVVSRAAGRADTQPRPLSLYAGVLAVAALGAGYLAGRACQGLERARRARPAGQPLAVATQSPPAVPRDAVQ